MSSLQKLTTKFSSAFGSVVYIYQAILYIYDVQSLLTCLAWRVCHATYVSSLVTIVDYLMHRSAIFAALKAAWQVLQFKRNRNNFI